MKVNYLKQALQQGFVTFVVSFFACAAWAPAHAIEVNMAVSSFRGDITQPLDGVCSSEALMTTGPQQKYNEQQCARALAPVRTQDRQHGNVCVCEGMLNTAFELGSDTPVTLADIEAHGYRCNDANFGDVYHHYGSNSQSQLAGRVFGGATGAIYSKRLTSPETAFNEIQKALENGRVVAVSLSAKPIYDYYAKTHNLTYESSWLSSISHTLVVRAVLRDADGKPSQAIIVDSSGPGRTYAVPWRLLKRAYQALGTVASRGVYISEKSGVKHAQR